MYHYLWRSYIYSGVMLWVFDSKFNDISAIKWCSLLLMEETGAPTTKTNRLQFTHYHGKKYMYIPPIYDHGHCVFLVHGGFLFRDFSPNATYFSFPFHRCYYFLSWLWYFTLFQVIFISHLSWLSRLWYFGLFPVIYVSPLSCLS